MARPEVIKRCFILNSAEHVIVGSFMAIVGIFIFISRENSMLNYVQQERICNCQ